MKGKEWTDAEMLEALTLSEEGLSMKAVGERIGRSKNSVIGTINRIRKEIAGQPETGNNTMPPRWWEQGLEKRSDK